ncbi:MAG TPA: FliM/FliN family flagellar motor C-terminal domain-containing protein, partial [Urbifossiella sp.]|nr:FliM/FliN family flagellar motor C-terminal domain-containing protein [Urbifossiella sp.]
MTPAPFDFRQPPPGALARQVAVWLTAAARRAAAAWPRLLPFPAEPAPGPVRLATVGAALADLPDDAVGFPLTTPDPDDKTAVLAMPRPLMLALLGGLLGEVPTALPADRDPSDLERSLTGYLARALFLDHLETAWPGDTPLAWTAGPPVAARAARRGSPDEAVAAATLTARTAVGDLPVLLILPRAGRWERLAEAAPPPPVDAPDPERIAALVREMTVDLTVVLGTAELTMSEAAGLRSGDLLVLRRKVGEPLDGLV